MFDFSPSNQNVDESLILCFNKIFQTFETNSIKKIDSIINPRLLNLICLELDDKYFSNMNLIFDDKIGIIYADIQEIVIKIFEYLKKSGTNFKLKFTEFEKFNINSLIKKDENEVKKLTHFLVVAIFNCYNKDNLISKFSSLEENIQIDIIRILEKYMVVDTSSRDSINSIRYSIRETFVEPPSSYNRISENDLLTRYLMRIENLERDKDNIEKEYKNLNDLLGNKKIEIESLKKEKNMLQENVLKLEDVNKNILAEFEELGKGKKRLEMEELIKETQKGKELKNLIDQKELEIKYLKDERELVEENYLLEIGSLKENIDLLKENISNLSEFKNNYDKLKDSIRDYEILKDKIKDYEETQKELAIIQKNYNKLNSINNEQEERIRKLQLQINTINVKNEERIITSTSESEQFKKQIKDLSEKIIDYEVKIQSLEENNRNLINKNEELIVQIVMLEQNCKKNEEKVKNDIINEDHLTSIKEDSDTNNSNIILSERFILESENENYKNTLKIKEETIQIQEEHITSLQEEINGFKTELDSVKKELANELNRKNEDVEFIKKESLELKEKYEREFELVSSSLYNLGLCYWSMKVEYTQKLVEKPTWLMKERQKFYNGDF